MTDERPVIARCRLLESDPSKDANFRFAGEEDSRNKPVDTQSAQRYLTIAIGCDNRYPAHSTLGAGLPVRCIYTVYSRRRDSQFQETIMSHGPIAIAMKVIDNVDGILGYWDSELKCQFANAAYGTWFGRSPEDMLGMSVKDLLGPLYDANVPYIQAALNGEVQVFEQQMPLPDGAIRHGLASYYPDISSGIVQGFSVQVTDVSRMKRLEMELQAATLQAELLATHDFLTGLPNRVLLMDRISAATAQAQRTGGLAGVVVIDLDGFKAINDTYGHAFGDDVLREIATRMKTSIRATDMITRLGGDEFVFLTSELDTATDLESAITRLLKALCQPLQCQGVKVLPSFSFGVALFPTNGTGAMELLASADRALYRAKRRKPARFSSFKQVAGVNTQGRNPTGHLPENLDALIASISNW